MSIYKDLLFMHGYVLDPGILADAVPAQAAASATPAPACAPLEQIGCVAPAGRASNETVRADVAKDAPSLAACA